jgi:hypothetical protein
MADAREISHDDSVPTAAETSVAIRSLTLGVAITLRYDSWLRSACEIRYARPGGWQGWRPWRARTIVL